MRNADQPLPHWQHEQVFFSAHSWFDDLQAGIAAATQSICLQTYIFDADAVGNRLLQSLCDASRRGVAVRVIVDGIGSAGTLALLQRALHNSAAVLHIYHPLPWHWAATRLERGDWLTRFFTRCTRLNNRQHSKLCLIDGNTAWTGSFNITARHLAKEQHALNWKDCGVRISGARCQLLREFFDAVWFHDVERLSSHFLLYPLTNFSRALRKKRLRTLLLQLHGARQRIWISSAYFAPIQPIVLALKRASRRGVDVRILVPARSDAIFFPALASTYYADLLRAGVRVYEYEHGILHTKHMLVDDIVTIGSSNMNHRSALHDVELDVELFQPASRQQIAADFRASMAASRAITLDSLGRVSAWLLALGQIPRLLRYWL